MSRPEVSVVMPFAGDAAAARGALDALAALDTRPGDELILADNSGTATATRAPGGITVVPATGERSPARARNAGAEHARTDWILFLDADCSPASDLLDAYFSEPVADDVGALAGEVVPAPGDTFVQRYGAARGFLSQQAHLEHPYRPRAVAANLLVRRAAFEQLGGFYEGVRAAEDTDFSWRLQAAGWRLELRSAATVTHRYRATLRELRRQWRGYAAGRAWLARRYQGFEPQPAVRRALQRGWQRVSGAPSAPRPPRRAAWRRSAPSASRRAAPSAPEARPLERSGYLALDALLAAEELAGLAVSNRPARARRGPVDVVIVADRFPASADPLVEFARTLGRARVEAVARPGTLDLQVARALEIDYREDDGIAVRALALAAVSLRHPLRAARDLVDRSPGEPKLSALAPAIRRLERDRAARVHAIGADQTRAAARRIATLAGRPLEQ